MSVHDFRTASAATDPPNDESDDETSSVFEWTARQQAAKGRGENLDKTSSIFDWTTQQQAAKSRGENLKRTSMIFERPARQKAESPREQVTPGNALPTTDEERRQQEPFEAGARPSRDPRLNDQESVAPRARVATVDPIEPERHRLQVPAGTETQLVGRTLANKYTIESVIGTGSMGTIYRARQIALDKPVSIKILHRELAEQRTFVERFKLEAFSASRFEHPNSLRVLDFGADGNLLHLVMEYVEADDLLTVMQRHWPFEDARIVEIMTQALAALAKAHEVGIVHRDLKPENILILRGVDDEGNATDVVKVCDFGIAKMAGASGPPSRPFAPHLTTEGLVVGTPDYMSPEQARGESVDGRSDLYSMGVVLYHMLTGRPPFVGDTPFGIAIQHVSEPPSPPSHHRVVNPALESICLRAMSKRPEDRFRTAREMRRALLDALTPRAETIQILPLGSETSIEVEIENSVAPNLAREPAKAAFVLAHQFERWRRQPRAVIAAAAVATVAIFALAALIARLGGQDSSWGHADVVRSTTTTLAPALPVIPASAENTGAAPTHATRPMPIAPASSAR